MACPDLIVKGEELLALVQTWFVAIIPTEYTSHVLLPRLKIFSFVSKIQNLQLFLMRVELAREREPKQSWAMFVYKNHLAFTEESWTQTFTTSEVRWWKSLESFCVAVGDEVILANLLNNRQVGREFKVNGQQEKVIKRQQVFIFNKKDM
jgi:hypothetical protein